MATVELKVNTAQMKAVRRRYERAQKRVKHGNKFFQRAAIIMHRNVIRHFRDEKGEDAKWKSLKKPRGRGGTKPLQDTGTLRASILFQGQVQNARVRTSLSYASFHDEGTSNIPKRDFMWLEREVERKLLLSYGKFIAEGSL